MRKHLTPFESSIRIIDPASSRLSVCLNKKLLAYIVSGFIVIELDKQVERQRETSGAVQEPRGKIININSAVGRREARLRKSPRKKPRPLFPGVSLDAVSTTGPHRGARETARRVESGYASERTRESRQTELAPIESRSRIDVTTSAQAVASRGVELVTRYV
ncbi:unnamed protein product, partial [Iphiclides podalirius]